MLFSIFSILAFLNLQPSNCSPINMSDTMVFPNQAIIYKAENLLECIGKDCEKIDQFWIVQNFTIDYCLKNLPISYFLVSSTSVRVARKGFIRPSDEMDSWEVSNNQEKLTVCSRIKRFLMLIFVKFLFHIN